MNRMLKSILTLTAFSAAALGLSAQPAVKLLTVDMNKLFASYYKTDQENAKLRASEQKAQEEFERMGKEFTQVADQYKETLEQSKKPFATDDAKAKAEADAAKLLEDIQRRQNDINTFKNNTSRMLSQQEDTIRRLLVEEIIKKVAEVAKGKGSTLVMDRNACVYAEAAYDITDDCLAAINKDRPAPPPPAATAPAATTSESPSVTVPGLAPKKK